MFRLMRGFRTSSRLFKTMKSFRAVSVEKFGGPEVLQYVPNLPALPNPVGKQVLIQVKSAGVNPVDTYIRSGKHAIKPTLPYVPGNDGAGIVEQVGNEVTKFKVGDRIYFCRSISGSYAEYALADESKSFLLHENLSFQQGAALGVPYFSAYRAVVTKAKLRPGQTILVHGASGAVGIACCQIARWIGARVYGTAGTEEGLKLVTENGAHEVFNHRQDDYLDKIKTATGGLDVIIEMLANVNLEKDLTIAKPDGQIIIVGSRDKTEITPRWLMMSELSITGVFLFKATEEEFSEMGSFMTAGQENGWLRPVVGGEYTLEDVQKAHEEVIKHTTGSKGKIVLTI